MAKRGRPSEQLKRETSEGRIWRVISKLTENGDGQRTIREVAELARCSKSAVAKTKLWKGYLNNKRRSRSVSGTFRSSGNGRRSQTKSVEGRVFQIIQDASKRNDFSLTVRQIADTIGCGKTTVGKTRAWKIYVETRDADKEAAKSRRREQRFL